MRLALVPSSETMPWPRTRAVALHPLESSMPVPAASMRQSCGSPDGTLTWKKSSSPPSARARSDHARVERRRRRGMVVGLGLAVGGRRSDGLHGERIAVRQAGVAPDLDEVAPDRQQQVRQQQVTLARRHCSWVSRVAQADLTGRGRRTGGLETDVELGPGKGSVDGEVVVVLVSREGHPPVGAAAGRRRASRPGPGVVRLGVDVGGGDHRAVNT